MYDAFYYDLAKQRIADLHRQADIERRVSQAERRRQREIEAVRVRHGFFWGILHPGKRGQEEVAHTDSRVA